MLQIDKLTAIAVDNKQEILKDFSMKIENKEVHAIMGPNGTGKSTLSKVIMGNYKYRVTSGDIIFNSESLLNLEVNERAKKGIFLAMQDPLSIEGITNSEFLKTALTEVTGERVNLYSFITEMENSAKDLKMNDDMLHRSLNASFSGGERKKNEVLQLKMLKPKLIILDELDSGLDVDSLKIVCENIKEYLTENKETSVLIITHYPKILEYLKPDYVHVMKDGKIVKTGDFSLAKEIEKIGYNSINDMKEVSNHE